MVSLGAFQMTRWNTNSTNPYGISVEPVGFGLNNSHVMSVVCAYIKDSAKNLRNINRIKGTKSQPPSADDTASGKITGLILSRGYRRL